MNRKNWLLWAFALVVLGLVAAAALIAIEPTTKAPSSQGKRSSATASSNKNSFDGLELPMIGDILDDETNPGIPLATAREKAAEGILIPSSKALGKIVRVRLTEAEAHRELVGIGILYDSGVKFFATPFGDKNKTFESILLTDVSPESFTDGRKQVYDVADDGKRKYMVVKGGVQGFDEQAHKVPPIVVFIVDGTEYRLQAASGDLNEKDLLKIAQEMH